MIEPACRTCRWWIRGEYIYPPCDPVIDDTWGQCRRTHGPDAHGSQARTATTDVYVTRPLYTEPAFWCRQYERANDGQ